jgi:hypothetical protein
MVALEMTQFMAVRTMTASSVVFTMTSCMVKAETIPLSGDLETTSFLVAMEMTLLFLASGPIRLTAAMETIRLVFLTRLLV